MKLNFVLGSFAIIGLVSACGTHAVNDLDSPPDGHGDGSGATGGSTGGGTASAGRANGGDSNTAGRANGDGDGTAGRANGSGTAGRAHGDDSNTAGRANSDGSAGRAHGDGSAGRANGDGTAGRSDTDGDGVGGSKSDIDDDAGGAPGDDSDNAGASDDGDGEGGSNGDDDASGGAPASGGTGGLPASGGTAGLASGGSGGISSTGGSAGISASGGSGDVSSTGGSAGLSASGGSGDVSSTGGSAGLSASGGSGGVAGTGGAGGSAGAGGNQELEPEYLFTEETFGGNGRTCTTCHTAATGTISPEQVEALYSADPSDPLFRPLDSDDGASSDYTELREHATFRVSINLPPGVTLTSDPTATSVVLRRSVPSTINTPALDPILMWDGREPTLTDQALSAVLGHSEGTIVPTSTQLDLIAQFEQGPDFFSSDLLRQYDQGGPAPTWPPGNTAEEQRGRRWFAQDSAAPRFNICGQCHGGPMANTTQSNSGLPVGQRFQTVNVSEFNHLNNPTYQFTFPDPKNPGKTVTVTTPDPGRALITGDVRDLNFFKIPSLWGVKNTAPYFHDNSAATLEELMDHYEQHLGTFLPKNGTYPSPHVPTAQDKADIVAYLKLL
jgi:cytochrome c peroxidase